MKIFFDPDIISRRKELLDKVKNIPISNVFRYTLIPKENFLKEYHLPEKNAFALSEGAMSFEFENNITLGFNSDVDTSSIIVWLEKTKECKHVDLLEDDDELYLIDIKDSKYSTKYFSSIVGQRLTKYEIIKIETDNPKKWNHPREVGLVMHFSNNVEIILSHQLTKKVSDDFTILQWNEIDKDSYRKLYKMSEFWD